VSTDNALFGVNL